MAVAASGNFTNIIQPLVTISPDCKSNDIVDKINKIHKAQSPINDKGFEEALDQALSVSHYVIIIVMNE